MLITRVVAAFAGAILALIVLVACGVPKGGNPEGAAEVRATAAQCAALFGQPVADDAGVLFVVVDGTRSRAGVPALPDAAIREVRAASLRREAVAVLAVDGAGAAPRWLLTRAALNHADLPDDVRKVAVAAERAPSCVEQVARSARPTAAGTDLGQAFRAVAEALPGSGRVDILALTDGVANTGAVDVSGRIAVEPVVAAVRDLEDVSTIGSLAGARVTIAGVGKVTGLVMPDASARWLRSFWGAWCRATGARTCSVPVQDQGVTGKAAARSTALPADRMPPLPAATRFRAAVRFSGDSAVLARSGEEALRPVVLCLAGRPGATGSVRVDGYVEPTGAPASSDRELAADRADAVARYLRAEAHVAKARLRAAGHGPGAPLPDRSSSRRVVFVSVEGGC